MQNIQNIIDNFNAIENAFKLDDQDFKDFKRERTATLTDLQHQQQQYLQALKDAETTLQDWRERANRNRPQINGL